ncbi:MAG: glucose-1-phosphate cytidylyltransferase [bacterium]
MKTVLLAGGFGTRLSEETDIKPKPMIEIGGKPILWHIMKLYSHYGLNDFIILLGYKGYVIKEYFTNYYMHQSDITVNLINNSVEIHKNVAEPWKVTLVDTGVNTMTGGRLKRVQDYIGNETFLLTYGDGLSNVNITETIKAHKESKKLATLTSVIPKGRFGSLNIQEDNSVSSFMEKPAGDGSWVNGGFFVLEPEIFNYIDGDSTIWEKEPLEKLAEENNLYAYRHNGFWQPMDTLREKVELEKLWKDGNAPWKIWE